MISLVLVACLVNTIMAFMGQNDLTLYFIINTVSFLIVTLLFTMLNPRARKTLNIVGAVFFSGFMVIVLIEVIDIITR